ncbi:hypothetical protein [Methylosinus sporium]|uniref:hypothetical protein n=1 Tax=Methylosinus sporium TaxID=428 RepID=UPI00383B4506
MTVETETGCGATVSGKGPWTEEEASVCTFAAEDKDERRCAAAALDAGADETAVAEAMPGSGVVATAASSSSSERAPRSLDVTTLDCEATARLPTVESEDKEAAGRDADGRDASSRPSDDTCIAETADCETLSNCVLDAPIGDAIVDASPNEPTRGSAA